MEDNSFKLKNLSVSIENHQTAAWADIEKTKSISKVPIPSITNVEEAKEWVDNNQK